MPNYSTQEMMIIAAAREIKDHERIFVGMRLPITAFGVARLTHAPNAMGLFECGIARYQPADGMLFTMSDGPNQLGAAWCTGLVQIMGLLSGGHADAGFIGGAQVDRFGNINSSYIGDFEAPKVKLPGTGGATDIAAMAGRLIAIMNHEKHRLVERVDYLSSVGFLEGGESRARAGLSGGGPAAVITDRAILRPYGTGNELHLASVHPGHTPEEVIENTGWTLKCLPEVVETKAPTDEEMTALHEIDSEGFWRS
ncbi:MAG: CoA-transferase [Alphaproteobacteria bacterium]|jgi:glutaconate CoA-transferase subunit B|nr:CoA-transferase [Rhodospirillaceae bacterium]MDP6406098.1 CoA-transferase [Alphaproteobacteria bacterium]MDP6620890.1 CoA-transferase [Alphaproteobacteria bacterium]|tara:strand:+ start:1733 stop:2494 length:762 start_codon:yes stop_codon:yes gene_type:complete